MKYDLIALDEVGYVPLADIGAEFLFQVIAERAEKTALILTTNLPFLEWTNVFPNPRLCKTLLDRVTDRAHIHRDRNGVLPFSSNGGREGKEESHLNSASGPGRMPPDGRHRPCVDRAGFKTKTVL